MPLINKVEFFGQNFGKPSLRKDFPDIGIGGI
jgi:hypothetical protein